MELCFVALTLNAEENITLTFEFPFFIPRKNGNECCDLEDVIEEHSHSSLQAECSQSRNVRECPNKESQHFRNSCCCNGRPNFSQTSFEPFLESFSRRPFHSCANNEHIVDSNSEDQKRDDFT